MNTTTTTTTVMIVDAPESAAEFSTRSHHEGTDSAFTVDALRWPGGVQTTRYFTMGNGTRFTTNCLHDVTGVTVLEGVVNGTDQPVLTLEFRTEEGMAAQVLLFGLAADTLIRAARAATTV